MVNLKTPSLHHHTTFSYMDGFGTPSEHVDRSVELEMWAQAATEHGNVSSHVGLEKAARKAGIKPIFGLEAYTHPDPESQRKFHLTLLAMDQVGYSNLNRVVSRSWSEGFYYYPTVSGQMLADHDQGIICLSGCSDSLLACTLLGGKDIPESEASFKKAQRVATNFRALYGDRYYLEVQAFPELPRAHLIAEAYRRLNEIHGIPMVVTFDVHTLRPGQGEMRALLHAAGRGDNTIAKQLSSWEYDVPDHHPLSDAYVLERLRALGFKKKQAQMVMQTTEEVALRCNVTLPKADRFRYKGTEADLSWN
jgi:DNA polymerase III subunit alpha